MLAGLGQFAIGLAWAIKFTLLGYLALVVIESAMFAVACALAPSGRGRVPALAALLTLAEWAREQLALRRRATRRDRSRPGRRPSDRHRPYRGHRLVGGGDLPRRRGARRPRRAGARPLAPSGPPAPSRCGPGTRALLSLGFVVGTVDLGRLRRRRRTAGAYATGGHRPRWRTPGPVRSAGPALSRLRRRPQGDGDACDRRSTSCSGRRTSWHSASRSRDSPENRTARRHRPAPSHDARRGRHLAGGRDPVPKRNRRLLPLGRPRRRLREGSPSPVRRVRPVAIVLLPSGEPAGRSPRRHRGARGAG